MSLLSIQHINTGYGKKQVLFDVSLDVKKGETVLLVGANGSGKSTLFKAIYGIIPIWKNENGHLGRITYDDKELTDVPSHHLIKQGIMYIPQKQELFEDLTVEQNLMMSVLHLNDSKEHQKRLSKVYGQLNLLKGKRKQRASKLSGGERKFLSLGMVQMKRPRLLLYDEPLAGLSSNNVAVILNWLKKIKENGTTMIIIEHRIKELIEMVDKVIGLKLGKKNTKILNNLEHIKTFMI